jgi:tryptophan-rich sensory protein
VAILPKPSVVWVDTTIFIVILSVKLPEGTILLLMMKKILPLLISIFIAESAGIIGSLFTISEITTWYATLIKPSFSPPNWLFGPVWTILYCLMGLSAFLIWKKRKSPAARVGLAIYGANLVANSLWSIVFFGFHRPDLALLVIFILWSTIVIMIKRFWPINQLASILLVPYLLWVSFATILNFAILKLNP